MNALTRAIHLIPTYADLAADIERDLRAGLSVDVMKGDEPMTIGLADFTRWMADNGDTMRYVHLRADGCITHEEMTALVNAKLTEFCRIWAPGRAAWVEA